MAEGLYRLPYDRASRHTDVIVTDDGVCGVTCRDLYVLSWQPGRMGLRLPPFMILHCHHSHLVPGATLCLLCGWLSACHHLPACTSHTSFRLCLSAWTIHFMYSLSQLPSPPPTRALCFWFSTPGTAGAGRGLWEDLTAPPLPRRANRFEQDFLP